MNSDLNITFKIEGPSSEEGLVPLPVFLTQLNLLQQSLKRFDALADEQGKQRVYYRIVDASQSKDLTMVLEPVGRLVDGLLPTPERIQRGHDRYFSELFSIQRGDAPSTDVDDKALEILRRLTRPNSDKIAAQKIFNSGQDVKLDQAFENKVTKLLKVSTYSRGTVTGRLDALNIHGEQRTFWIYPITGPTRIKCKFLPGELDQARKNLGKIITVEGIKSFRANADFPHFVDCREFWAAPPRLGSYSDIIRRRDTAALNNQLTPGMPHEW